MKKIALLAVFLLIPLAARASTLIYSEDFDDQSISSPPTGSMVIYKSLWQEISLGEYSYGEGRGSSGYSIGSGTHYAPALVWMNVGDWSSGEIYVSFWLRYPSYTPDEDAWWNIKVFYPHWDGVDSYVMYNTITPTYGTHHFSAHDKDGNILTDTGGAAVANDMDGNWHRYEYYINFDSGLHKFWYDRPVDNWTDGSYLKRDDDFGTGVWGKNIYYIPFTFWDAGDTNAFTRFVDDIEVWDGMPGSGSSPAVSGNGVSGNGVSNNGGG